MILRMGATVGALAPVAVRAQSGAVMAAQPTVWIVLGYPFEAGSMIAALCACLAVRFYVGQTDGAHWSLKVPVLALALMFTAGGVITLRPTPLIALLLGTGLGAVGAGIIAYAKRWVDRWLGPLAGDAPPAAAPAPAMVAAPTTGLGEQLGAVFPPVPTTDDQHDLLLRIHDADRH